jgi:hypothetical protein
MIYIINSKVRASRIIWIVILIGLLNTSSASGSAVSDLRELTSSFDDPKMTVQDLAYYLFTHNYDAAPRSGYVDLQLDGKRYKLVPNGNSPGLCNILS